MRTQNKLVIPDKHIQKKSPRSAAAEARQGLGSGVQETPGFAV